MKHTEDRPARMRMPRSRGAVTGLLLVLLGAWGALIPFVGPNFDFAYTPGQSWTAARGWLEVLPGAATAVGGLLLIVSRNRATAMLGGWLATFGGAWFIVGTTLAPLLRTESVGDPVAVTDRKRAVLELAYFTGLGTLIVFLGGAVLSRLAVRLARDVVPVTPATAVEPATPASQAYAHPVETDHTDVSSQAMTAPRPQQYEPDAAPQRRHGLWRRHHGVNA
ncbi:hypothetical protein A5725_20355 [Mycobacterium kubicae]|uniref:hypothetical protein n=1 Tax=Mycobacterium kubicae TaxID=120959 RepID=UPI0008014656|nr:hypothetical protein [Mycobacterium kubicae]OBF18059.1 hypothetical protein A5725_20355 [Mycobacterium kubicae]